MTVNVKKMQDVYSVESVVYSKMWQFKKCSEDDGIICRG